MTKIYFIIACPAKKKKNLVNVFYHLMMFPGRSHTFEAKRF